VTFLFVLPGELSEYVTSELNVLALDTCSDPLAYAELSAVPDWQGLGKRLGKDMGKVRAGAAAAASAVTSASGFSFECCLCFGVSGVMCLSNSSLADMSNARLYISSCL
jgi:hypothetical protein